MSLCLLVQFLKFDIVNVITWLRHTFPLPLSPKYRHTLSTDNIWSHCSMPVRFSKIGCLLTRQNFPSRCVQNGGTFSRDNRHRTAKRNQRTCQIDVVTWVNTGSWDFFKMDFVATMSTNWRNVRYQPTQSDIPSRTLGIVDTVSKVVCKGPNKRLASGYAGGEGRINAIIWLNDLIMDHGPENCDYNRYSPSRTWSDEQQHTKGDSFMQIAVLDGQGHNQTTDEHHVGLLHVSDAHFARAHDAQQREQNDRNQTGHGQRKSFRHPVDSHQDDHVSRPTLLSLLTTQWRYLQRIVFY